jgi:glutamate dehydrogenase/leucine dehydrogenase
VANAGGVLALAGREVLVWSEEALLERVERIYDTMLEVFAIAAEQGVPPYVAADRLAERRLASLAAEKAGLT